MQIFHVFEYTYEMGPNRLLHSFTSKELAEEMIELYVRHTWKKLNDFYIEECEVINSVDNLLFQVKSLDYFFYDGEEIREHSYNSLRNDSGSQKDFLDGNIYAMDGFYVTHELVDKDKPKGERQKKLNLFIQRPIAIGLEGIKEEWNRIYKLVKEWHHTGFNQEAIQHKLKHPNEYM